MRPQLHGLHRATTQCVADTIYGAMHICLGTGSNAQCVAGNCHDTSGECTTVGQICGITTPHVCGGCGDSDTACRTTRPTATAPSAWRALCVDRRLPRHVHRLHRRPALRRLDGAHLRRLRDRRAPVHRRHPLRQRQHLLPGELPGRQLPRHQPRLQRRQRGTSVRRDHAARLRRLLRATRSAPAIRSTAPTTICNTATGANQGKCVSTACKTVANGPQQQRRARPTPATSAARASCVPGNCCSNTDCANNPLFGERLRLHEQHLHALRRDRGQHLLRRSGQRQRRRGDRQRQVERRHRRRLQLQDGDARDAGDRNLRRRRHQVIIVGSGSTADGPGGRRQPADHGPAERRRSRRPAGRSPSSSRTRRARRTRRTRRASSCRTTARASRVIRRHRSRSSGNGNRPASRSPSPAPPPWRAWPT